MVTKHQIELASQMFKALADPLRLKTIMLLAQDERSVGELSQIEGDKIGTVSARLKVLLNARLVERRKDGQRVIYSIADHHILALVSNALEHACEHRIDNQLTDNTANKEEFIMSTCNHPQHANHDHEHGENCGHTAVKHGDHIDFLHDGHLHHPHDGHVDEHVIEVSSENPDGCHPIADHLGHDHAHVHGPNCGHEAVPHGDHVDYLVDGRLHHPHGDHCDDHGPLEVVSK
ncbi:ArsR/SmtB family transcription factor [Bartonella sp. HY761]|uniref:ArsR/SmtB family transcription factor n=2 Tax=Bartonella TaxID=773 RepID=UPI0021F928C6|nr:metalloregulator ArsR/SmtB family transcription factor [Bartonella sp. HY761]UXN06217.1 metalloregulator ArsR/SmtB family transcription factor [Bartonella sp. HY761]